MEDSVSGECSICGLPGVVGLRCSDPDCPGTIERLPEVKQKPTEDDRYSDELLEDPSVVSLETLAEEEDKGSEEV